MFHQMKETSFGYEVLLKYKNTNSYPSLAMIAHLFLFVIQLYSNYD